MSRTVSLPALVYSLVLVFVLLLGCAENGTVRAGEPAVQADPQAVFSALEQRLLDGSSVSITCSVESKGAIECALAGTAFVGDGNRAKLDVKGTFSKAPVELMLESDGKRMQGGAGTKKFDSATPSALKDGLIIGFIRMGLLHNLAMLSSGSEPDGMDGGARQWVTVAGFKEAGKKRVGGIEARGIAFDITVGGKKAARAVLWLDPATGLPVLREQVVQFPSGEMRVTERYTAVEVGPSSTAGASSPTK